MEEIDLITKQLAKYLSGFKAKKVFLRWNLSCPNTGHDVFQNFIESFDDEYAIISTLKVPIIVKVGYNFPYEVAKKLEEYEYIFGFEAINTIRFDELPEAEKKEYFDEKYVKTGHDTFKVTYPSPLEKEQYRLNVKGPGGISGNPIRKYAIEWIQTAREHGITKPIIGGGGILWPWHVLQFKKAGANAIALGSISFLRPFCLLACTITAKIVFRKH
jgi:dihydroorotate dehydrogenase